MIIKNPSDSNILFPRLRGEPVDLKAGATVDIDKIVGKQLLDRYGFLKLIDGTSEAPPKKLSAKKLEEEHFRLFGKEPDKRLKPETLRKRVEDELEVEKKRMEEAKIINARKGAPAKDTGTIAMKDGLPHLIIGSKYVLYDEGIILMKEQEIKSNEKELIKLRKELIKKKNIIKLQSYDIED